MISDYKLKLNPFLDICLPLKSEIHILKSKISGLHYSNTHLMQNMSVYAA